MTKLIGVNDTTKLRRFILDVSGAPLQVWDRFPMEVFMDLIAAIKREERKLEKELGKLQGKLSGLHAAAKALGSRTSQRVTEVKKRLMSLLRKRRFQRQ